MKPVTLSQLLVTMSVTLLSLTFQANAKEYYKWVDSKGVTTYSATPPPSQKQEQQLDSAIKNVNAMASTPSVVNVAATSNVKDLKTTIAPNPQAAKSTTHTAVSNTTITTASETLFTVKDCNGVRCWDTQGKHYNFVSGRTYLSATGGKCQKIGNNMHCNK
ncbi:MAG: DUF4124 domain-containing protein [Acinetobacter sp.]|jgi:hypothetical protein